MATAMKKRRQILALDRLQINPYQLPQKPTDEAIKRAARLGKEREKLIEATRGTDRLDLAFMLGEVV